MTKKADNPEVDSAEIIIPSIPKEETSATENLAKDNLPPLDERYKKSSEEGIRLAKDLKAEKEAREKEELKMKEFEGQLGEYKDFTPFIDALQKDPKLVEHITSYCQPNEEELQDLDLTDPKEVDKLVEKRAREIIRDELATFKQSSQKESAMEAHKTDFLGKHPEMSRDDVDGLIKWSKDNPMTLEHLFMLKNPDQISKKVAEATRTDLAEQQRKISDTPASLATANSEGKPASPVDELFNAMKSRIDGSNMDVQIKSE